MSKRFLITGTALTVLAALAGGATDAEARGFGSGVRAGGFAGFRAPAPAFRPAIGNLPSVGNRIGGIGGIGGRIGGPRLGGLPGLKPGLPGLRPTLPPGLKLPPPGLRPRPNPGGPGGLLPPPPDKGGGGGKGGGVAVGIAVGTGLALAASSECSYPYRKWRETGLRSWKDRYYSCMGY